MAQAQAAWVLEAELLGQVVLRPARTRRDIASTPSTSRPPCILHTGADAQVTTSHSGTPSAALRFSSFKPQSLAFVSGPV